MIKQPVYHRGPHLLLLYKHTCTTGRPPLQKNTTRTEPSNDGALKPTSNRQIGALPSPPPLDRACNEVERRLLVKRTLLPDLNCSRGHHRRSRPVKRWGGQQQPTGSGGVSTSSRKVQNHIRDLELISSTFEED